MGCWFCDNISGSCNVFDEQARRGEGDAMSGIVAGKAVGADNGCASGRDRILIQRSERVELYVWGQSGHYCVGHQKGGKTMDSGVTSHPDLPY